MDSIEVTNPPAKTVYTAGEPFSAAGLKGFATYSDGSFKSVTDYTLTWNSVVLAESATTVTAEAGAKLVTVMYKERTAFFLIAMNPMNSAKTDDTTAPGTVTGLGGTPGDGRVTLAWADPPDADLASIEITWTPGGTAPQTVARGAGTYTAAGLTNGTAYAFTVKAKDAAGNLSAGVPGTALTANSWVTGTINLPYEVNWYKFTVATAGTYYVRWDDPYLLTLGIIGFTSSSIGDISVSAYRANGTLVFSDIYNGYSSPRFFSASVNETIYTGRGL